MFHAAGAARPRPSTPALAAMSLVATIVLLTPSFGSAMGPTNTDAGRVTYVTTYDPPGAGAPVSSVHVGRVGRPTRLDIVGSGRAELIATFEVLTAGGAGLTVDRVTRRNASPDALPLAITATASIPQSGARSAAVGYDALASSAPLSFQGSFDFQNGATSVTLATASPGAGLDVVASLVTPDAPGIDPNVVRIGFEPVPASASAAVRAGAVSAELALTSATPTSVDVHAEAGAVVLDAAVPNAPTPLTLDIVDEGTAGKAVTYRAAAPVSEITATLRETSGAAVAQETLVALEDAPTAIDIVQAVPGSVEFTADSTVGLADIAFARGGAAETLDPLVDPAHVYHFDDGTTSSTSLYLSGLEHADVVLGDTLSLDASAAAGPLRLLLEDGNRTMDAHIEDAPSAITLAYDPSAGTMQSAGSAAIGQISVEASDPDGLMSRATSVDLLVRDIPTALDLGFSSSGDSVSVDAHGQEIGLLEVTATNGPAPTIPAGRDGLVLQDQGAAYLLFARITGLRRATADLAPDPTLFLDATGNRAFQVDLNANDGSEDVFARAMFDRLQPQMTIQLAPHGGGGSKLIYSAASPADSLFFTTNGDDESDFIEATLAPVPASLEVCSSKDTACNTTGQASNAGAVRISASEHTTINLFECIRPLTGCTASNATESTALTNLFARILGLDTNVGGGGLNGRVFFDTDNHGLTGQIVKRMPNPTVDRLTVTLPNGFRAQDRMARWPGDPTVICVPFFGCFPGPPAPVTRSGSITCPPGTAFDVRLTSLTTVDVDFYVCP